MPSPDLAAIEARAAAATEGPWELNYTLGLSSWPIVVADGIGLIADVAEGGMSEVDAAFIAHVRTDVPALIARIRELEAENAKIDDLDEALRQRDREILGLRRDRGALATVRTLAAGVKLRMVPSGGVETQRHRGAVEFAEEVLGAISGKPR